MTGPLTVAITVDTKVSPSKTSEIMAMDLLSVHAKVNAREVIYKLVD